MSDDQTAERDRALAARDAMATRLKGRLMEVLGSDDPATAIVVCAEEAPQIAADVSQEHGVSIGRTSFRLRNPKNAPPDWATQFVADRIDEPIYLSDGRQLGALLPIRLEVPCLICHGPEDAISQEIKESLEEHYPDDQATGFRRGDLRGWFWVNVPYANESMFTAEVARQLHERRDYHNERLRAHCTEHRIPLADICSRLQDEHFGDALHPNGAGAKIIAEEVFGVLLALVESTSIESRK